MAQTIAGTIPVSTIAARPLERGDDRKPLHAYVLHALAAIRDEGAAVVLVTYIRRGPTKLPDAFRALHEVDPDAARGEAAALPAKGARSEARRAILREYAERRSARFGPRRGEVDPT